MTWRRSRKRSTRGRSDRMPHKVKIPASVASLDLDRVRRALFKADGNVTKAAKALKVSSADLRRLTWRHPKLIMDFHNRHTGVRFPSLATIAGSGRLQSRHGRDGNQGSGRGGAPDMGAPDKADARALPRPLGRHRLALAGAENEQRLQLQRSEMFRVSCFRQEPQIKKYFLTISGRLRRPKDRPSRPGKGPIRRGKWRAGPTNL